MASENVRGVKEMRSSTTWVLCALLFLSFGLVAVAPAGAQGGEIVGESIVIGEPEIEVSVTDNRLEAGESVGLTVTLSNSGELRVGGPEQYQDRVKTARNVRVSIDEEELNAPLDVKTGTVVLGDLREGEPRTATFRVETEEDAETGRYIVPIRLEYDSTRIVEYSRTRTGRGITNPRYRGEREETVVREAEIVFESEPRFEAVSSTVSGLYAGDTGVFELTLRNTGDETARDATVRLETGSSEVSFGPLESPRESAGVSFSGTGAGSQDGGVEYDLVEGESGSELVPSGSEGSGVSGSDLAPGESKTVSVKMNAGSETVPGSYPVSARVEYFNENGVEEVSDRLQAQVEVGEERRFSIDDLQTERLRVDENDAVVRGTVVNTGTATAHNAVVTVSTEGPVRATGPESAVGDLEPDGSAEVRFDLAVAEDAEPGRRSLTFDVVYENDEGDLRNLDSPVRKTVTVGEEVEAFEVVGVSTSVEAGGTDTVEVEVRNNDDYTIENANAKMFLNDPLSSSDNSAFLGNMEAGETKTAVFKISATGDAVAKEYDASIEVRYDDRSGDTELDDDMRFGVPVNESSGGLPLPFVVAGIVVVAASGAVFIYQRRS